MSAPRELWECPNCAFGFDAIHRDEDGGYSCPACEADSLRSTITRLESTNTKLANMLSTIRDHVFLGVQEVLERDVEEIDAALASLNTPLNNLESSVPEKEDES